jgi:hypothetical protein
MVDWTLDVQMLAALIEITDSLVRVAYYGATGKRHPGRPVHIPRPKPPRTEGDGMTQAERIRRFFGSAVEYVPPDSGG